MNQISQTDRSRAEAGVLISSKSDMRRKIFALAWPAIAYSVMHTIVGLVDMMMVGRLGPVAVASVGLSSRVFWLFMSLGFAVSGGTVAMVARYMGAQDRPMAEKALRQSMIAGVSFALPMTGLGIAFIGYIFQAFAAEPDVVAVGTRYAQIILLGNVPLFIAIIGSSGLRAAGDTRTPLWIGVIINVINVGLNYVLIFGKLGFPALGVDGAAIASAISLLFEGVAYVVLLQGHRLRLHMSFKDWSTDWSMIGRLFRVGYPTALDEVVMGMGFLIYLRIITTFGTGALAAYLIGVQILSFTFSPGWGFSIAASALVGQNLGAERPDVAARAGWHACRLALCVMLPLSVIFVLFARPITLIFIEDPAVVSLTVIFMYILASVQPAMAYHFSLGGSLRGAGDTRWPLYCSIIGLYAFRITLAFLLGIVLGFGLYWAWFALVADHYSKAMIMAGRFTRGKWKEVKV